MGNKQPFPFTSGRWLRDMPLQGKEDRKLAEKMMGLLLAGVDPLPFPKLPKPEASAPERKQGRRETERRLRHAERDESNMRIKKPYRRSDEK